MKFNKIVSLIFSYPSVVLPFFILTLIEALFLSLWYYSPRPLISLILAPPIRVFMGEKFLHYPYLFLMLPRVMFISRVFVYLGCGISALIMTICSLYQVQKEKRSPRFWPNLNRALRNLPVLSGVGMLFCTVAFLLYKIPRVVIAKFVFDNLQLEISSYVLFLILFIFLALGEGLFTASCVNYVLKNNNLGASIKNAFSFVRSRLLSLVLFICSVRLLILGLTLIKWHIPYLLKNMFVLFPELVLVILILEIIVYFVANILIVSGITLAVIESEGG
ncbi:MAG: hypothetical protein ABIG64_01050 [Candidatus Omnitrophota bacterium]